MIHLIQYAIAALLVINITAAVAQEGQDLLHVKKQGNTFLLETAVSSTKLTFCTSDVVRIRTSWTGTFETEPSLMVVRDDWPPSEVAMTETDSTVRLVSDSLIVHIIKSPFSIQLYDQHGALLSADCGGPYREGERTGVRKALQAEEYFFGFGERMDFINQRNKKLTLKVGRGKGRPHEVGAYNILEANYSPVPFFMSTRGYGIFLHNPYTTQWDMGHSDQDAYAFEAEGGELDYYFIYGPTFKNVVKHYTNITGKSPMLPKFAFGLHAGTYSGGTWGHEEQTSDAYVIALARKFRELGIPIDLLWLDSTWRIFGKNGGKGATSFEWRETFADPKGMFDSLYALNYAMVGLHLRPRFDNGQTMDLLDQARAGGYVYPEQDETGKEVGEFVNFFDQQSVDWWWDNGVKRVADLGAMFLKTDEGSAFGGKANESDKMGPVDEQAKKLHNVFPIAYAKAPYEKFQAYNGIRGLNQTREGYAGIQRYPFIFAGDWPSEWQYFLPVIRAGLNMGLSGVGYWTHCMGGFEHVADPELYIRWVQFGMFSPIAMVFGMDHPGYKEPWNYGEEALANFRKYDRLRYRLIPYIYSHAYGMYTDGTPLMRAMVMEHQQDRNVYEIDDQYLFGNDLLVCPVVTKRAKTRTVYLPEGIWFDYWTGKRYEGRQYIHVTTPLDTMPIFAKAGAIIPMQREMDYVGQYADDEMLLDIFPAANGHLDLYDDDGMSLDYQAGAYAVTPIHSFSRADHLNIQIGKPSAGYDLGNRAYTAKIRWDIPQKPRALTFNGRNLQEMEQRSGSSGWFYDAEAGVVWVDEKMDHGELNVFY
ncbi:glycoside hydrolase family 31 protein [Parapedobacter tibetensis]|uniref:glycoside hydrolase family 31 protein n=1 Tax=Parapedobacter tibetensis TaxID=2972951 RepID=UPI00214D7FDC|nr:TIM-barrel domain-containing protein [Parapedobacter tibetensis]